MDDKIHLLTVEDDEELEGLGFGEEPSSPNKLRKPVIAFFHIAFKAGALLVYLFSGIYGSGYIGSFVTVIIFLALDFWTVKNITGRLLVGYRWWNHVDSDGNSQWIFEARKGPRKGGRGAEKRVFWIGLIVPQILWGLFFFWSTFTFRFQWTILVALANILNGANLYGYVRCMLGHQPGISDATGFLGQGLTNMILQRATAGPSTTASQNQNAFTQQV